MIHRFRPTKLDAFVVTVVIVVFLWAFFIDSWRPMLDEDGEPIMVVTKYGLQPVPHINMQVFIAPIILVYEACVLIFLDGKPTGRELPWRLYYETFIYMIKCKFRDGMQEYHEWKNIKNR